MTHSRGRWADVLCLLLAIALSLLACCVYYQCFKPETLSQPWFTFGDVPLTESYAKVAAEGQALPWKPRMVQRLNAPFVANWCDFPTPDELVWDAGGVLVACFGVIRAYNLAILAVHGLAASGFYLAARCLGAARAPALFCGVSYSMARYLFVRDSVHINLSCCWHVPFFWVTADWFWRRKPMNLRFGLALLALCAVTAWQNPYYWFFWLVMLVPCWLVPLCQRDFRAAGWPLATTALSCVFLFLGQLDSWLGWQTYGRGYAFVRDVHELLVYGLRLPEFFLPQGHHWSALDGFAYQHYYRPMVGNTGETDSSYLGLVGLLAGLWMVVDGVRRRVRNQPAFFFLMSLWLAFVMLNGGLTMLGGSFGLLLFRCSNRSSIVFQAGLLLFLALRLTHWRILNGRRSLLIVPLLAFTAWDCFPPFLLEKEAVSKYVQNQRAAVDYLQAELPSRSMVFQWPLMEYPESQRVGTMWHYDHLMAFLYSKDLRFSYGDCRNRPETQWQSHLVGKSPAAIATELRSYGFAAIWLNTNGLDETDRSLWRDWRTPDYRSPGGDLWVYRLQPNPHPILPRLEPTLAYSGAFFGPESDPRLGLKWRWAWGPARLDLLLPNPCLYRFRFGLNSIGPERTVVVRLDGKTISRAQVPAQYGVYRQLEVDLSRLKPGAHRIELLPDGPALPPVAGGRRLTFSLVNPTLEPLAGP
ncbi:MAG: hypothetical protein J0I12_27865 [Candidatus Eremiobacteraeota bacterium]|nr:hypothetical protein [Candidatus Eremiobacteraeota bacterium]